MALTLEEVSRLHTYAALYGRAGAKPLRRKAGLCVAQREQSILSAAIWPDRPGSSMHSGSELEGKRASIGERRPQVIAELRKGSGKSGKRRSAGSRRRSRNQMRCTKKSGAWSSSRPSLTRSWPKESPERVSAAEP
ncbi:hypothetical protein MPNT_220010 [Candidatus Methylacidithermus pantelleriae]|uniref:Uncharacterized protein n=1 Tax=Candidatus Methylacidithermus pantelleriae TaxID=2744239 RepID=A0A8J2BTC0_9BACT|nr:hypothetical protein MPNT_220010 [Candidatus Methylacidithermus pantelleriae]